MNEPEKYLTPEKMNEVRQRNRSLRRQFLNSRNAYIWRRIYNCRSGSGINGYVRHKEHKHKDYHEVAGSNR